MKRIKLTACLLGATMALFAVANSVNAQPAAGQGQNVRPQRDDARRGFRNLDPQQMRERMEQMQERMLERYQETLGLSDTEFEAVKPLLNDVMEKRRQVAAMGGRMGFGGPRGFGGFGDDDSNTAADALQQTLENENADAATINDKLKAFRSERDKAEKALKQSRDKLRKVLTTRQEATLVLMGILD